MYIDKSLELSSSQAVTASAASTNYIDLGSARKMGVGEVKYIHFTVDTTTVSAGATTMDIEVEVDDNTSFSSAKVVASKLAIPKADLVAGYQIYLPIPIEADERYLRINYTVDTANFSAGAFSAGVVDKIQENTVYPDGIA